VGPCHHSMKWTLVAVERPPAMEGKILNKQPQTKDKEWSSSLGVGHGADNHSP
jgi:hypothetical protein